MGASAILVAQLGNAVCVFQAFRVVLTLADMRVSQALPTWSEDEMAHEERPVDIARTHGLFAALGRLRAMRGVGSTSHGMNVHPVDLSGHAHGFPPQSGASPALQPNMQDASQTSPQPHLGGSNIQ